MIEPVYQDLINIFDTKNLAGTLSSSDFDRLKNRRGGEELKIIFSKIKQLLIDRYGLDKTEMIEIQYESTLDRIAWDIANKFEGYYWNQEKKRKSQARYLKLD